MSKMQRSKGRRGELEALALLGDYGIDGEIVYGQEERGGRLGDLDTDAGRWEVKRRACLPVWMRIADAVRGVFVRGDRGKWYVLVRGDDLLDLIRRLRNAERRIN